MSVLSSRDVLPQPDFILVGVDGEEYEVSREILSQHSDHFRVIFAHPESKECQQGRYVFSKEIDPKNYLKLVIDFMKTKDITITSENAVYIFIISDYLQITDLESTVKKFIESIIVTEGKRQADIFKIFKVCCEFENKFTEYRKKTMEILIKKPKEDISHWNMKDLGESFFVELISHPCDEPEKQLVMSSKFMENNPSCSSMVQIVMLLLAKSPMKLSNLTSEEIVYLPPKVIFTLLSSNNLKILSEYDVCSFIQNLLSAIDRLKIDKGEDFCTRIWECCRFGFLLTEQIQELVNNVKINSIPSHSLMIHLLSRTGISVPSSYQNSALTTIIPCLDADRGIPFIVIEKLIVYGSGSHQLKVMSVSGTDLLGWDWNDCHRVLHGKLSNGNVSREKIIFQMYNYFWKRDMQLLVELSYNHIFYKKSHTPVKASYAKRRSLLFNYIDSKDFAINLQKLYSKAIPNQLTDGFPLIEINGSCNGVKVAMKLRQTSPTESKQSQNYAVYALYKWSDFEFAECDSHGNNRN